MNIVRHANRRPPAAKIVCKPDVIRWNDSDTFTLDHLTRAEAERIYRLALTDVRLYGLTFALGQMLGYEEGAQA